MAMRSQTWNERRRLRRALERADIRAAKAAGTYTEPLSTKPRLRRVPPRVAQVALRLIWPDWIARA